MHLKDWVNTRWQNFISWSFYSCIACKFLNKRSINKKGPQKNSTLVSSLKPLRLTWSLKRIGLVTDWACQAYKNYARNDHSEVVCIYYKFNGPKIPSKLLTSVVFSQTKHPRPHKHESHVIIPLSEYCKWLSNWSPNRHRPTTQFLPWAIFVFFVRSL